MDSKKITLELNEKQALVIKEAVELLSRLGMGQMNALDNVGFLNERRFKNKNIDYTDKEKAIFELKKVYFPELYGHQYWGMTNEQTHEDAKIAWDINQVIRHAVSWHNHPKGGITVSFDLPMKVSGEELATCKYKDSQKE